MDRSVIKVVLNDNKDKKIKKLVRYLKLHNINAILTRHYDENNVIKKKQEII